MLVATISLSFALSFGLKDNMNIVYHNYRSVINASTLVTSESLKILNINLFKASGWESQAPTIPEDDVFSRMNYLEGVDYQKASKNQ